MKKLFFLLLVLALTACNGGSVDKSLQAKVDSLSAANAALAKELEGYKNDPANLCANIEELLKAEKVSELSAIKTKLEKYHPASPQLDTVNFYIARIKDVQTKRAQEEQAKRMQAVKVLRSKFDDVNNTTWYQSRNSKTSGNFCYMYIGKSDATVWLRLKMQYHGEDWIFFENAYLSYDGNTIEIPFDKYRNKETEVADGVWEWLDVSIDDRTLAFIKKMVNGKTCKWRLSGKYNETRTFSSKEIAGFKEVLLAYDVLQKGK